MSNYFSSIFMYVCMYIHTYINTYMHIQKSPSISLSHVTLNTPIIVSMCRVHSHLHTDACSEENQFPKKKKKKSFSPTLVWFFGLFFFVFLFRKTPSFQFCWDEGRDGEVDRPDYVDHVHIQVHTHKV